MAGGNWNSEVFGGQGRHDRLRSQAFSARRTRSLHPLAPLAGRNVQQGVFIRARSFSYAVIGRSRKDCVTVAGCAPQLTNQKWQFRSMASFR